MKRTKSTRSVAKWLLVSTLICGSAAVFTSCGENTLEEILGAIDNPSGSTVAVTGITLNKASLRLYMNNTETMPGSVLLTAAVYPDNATDQSVTWSSSDETKATVDETGKVTAVAKGTATITAKAGDKTATRTVYVYDKIVDISTDISVDADASWLINGTGTTKDKSITIANNSKVTLNGINITKGINCTDNATIILADGSTNTVTAPSGEAGIKIGDEATETLTIDAETEGTGQLTVQGGLHAAGIGTDGDSEGGNIVINGGTVTAEGGSYAAGIGTGVAYYVSNECGTITINGGTVTAEGGSYAAGIGTGWAYMAANECGAITIGTGVTSVTATKGTGTGSFNSIGIGLKESYGTQTCGTITIGGVEYWDGSNYKNGGDDATTGLPHSPYIYPAP